MVAFSQRDLSTNNSPQQSCVMYLVICNLFNSKDATADEQRDRGEAMMARPFV